MIWDFGFMIKKNDKKAQKMTKNSKSGTMCLKRFCSFREKRIKKEIR